MMIDKRTVIAIHKMLVAEFGGLDGIRDKGLLESALARSSNITAYEPGAGIFKLISALTFALIKNHPFIDGNKRIGAVVCEVCLAKKGYLLHATEEEKYAVYMNIASSAMTEQDFALWLEDKCKSYKN